MRACSIFSACCRAGAMTQRHALRRGSWLPLFQHCCERCPNLLAYAVPKARQARVEKKESVRSPPCSSDGRPALCLTGHLHQPATLGRMRCLENNKENRRPWGPTSSGPSLGGGNHHRRAGPLGCSEALEKGSTAYTSRRSGSGVGDQRDVGLFVSTQVIWMSSAPPQKSLRKYFLPHGVWATDLVLPWLSRWMRQVHTLQWHHRWLENPQEIGQAPSLRVTAVTALPRGHPKLGAGNWQSYTCFSAQPAWVVPFTSLPCSQELRAMLTTLGGTEGSPVGYMDLLQDVVAAFPMIQVSSLRYLGPLLLPVQCCEIK